MNVRLVRRTDASPLARLSEELGYSALVDEVRIRLGAVLAHPDHAAFVAEHPDLGVVGWIHVFAALRIQAGSFAEIGGLMVAESHRETGIGRQLVDKAEEWSWQRGLSMLRVRSHTKRMDARAFYQRLGFREVKTQRVFVKEL